MVKTTLRSLKLHKSRLSPSFIIWPSVLLVILVIYRFHFAHIAPFYLTRWSSAPSRRPFSLSNTKKCHLVAMVITSETDFMNGTVDAWFNTLPPDQTQRVCCISVRRSPTTTFSFQPSSNSCDTMFVPMVRDDEYLTISEKVILGFSRISSYYSFEWLLKTDADSFVCFSRLLKLLSNYDPMGVTQLGYAESRNILLEDPNHKWYDPSMTDIVHNSRQPVISGTGIYHPYMQGAGYVLSRGAVSRIEASLPSLRYSPMEDAMVGSWMLSLNAHWAVLDLDLRALRWKCKMPGFLYISHYRKGPEALNECFERNSNCSDLSTVHPIEVTRVAFLVTAQMETTGNQVMDLYDSIRAIFPTNEIIIGDMSPTHHFLSRMLTRTADVNLRGIAFSNMPVALVRNELVSSARSPYVCMLTDAQRLSWEAMIGRMLEPVQTGEADITTGFLSFNPHMPNSSYGLIDTAYTFSDKPDFVFKQKIQENFTYPNVSIPVHGTNGFLLARRKFLEDNPWRDLGPFADDEFYYRLYRDDAKILLVNSGVRHGYHYPLNTSSETVAEVRMYAPKMCNILSKYGKGPSRMTDFNVTLDCRRHVFKRAYADANWTSLNTLRKW